ncbi:NAD(P)/FAD-dependent oxidoreductase [Pseudoroseomonas wenyumeiae]|uniref:NAD(P)/FAD-dependent oxidoreductase n=1 Tax=Teichococcus wenyumeiae TaxID=2478470 RepID=A0A3A9J9B2_9PROT|nr:ArsO family NAD(P)H-dependent flavin-containing monooxygenase [Pseudoroseomonas wenyumeiae]RKK02640.1 NAD(P)/FAD-dependent oxidoreductase [Pseudoroseomonas wenyumeiae]RMI15391.1 NAD(P)/FAD-dependent oxidoreductase [Pseudoroseomonas wenyumeiae]
MSPPVFRDVVVIGGGQSGLAAGYFLRRGGLDFEILDANNRPGGAWPDAWDSLRLFSPAEMSSLPGWPMPPSTGGYPTRDHVVDYLTAYEQRYSLPVQRPVRVKGVLRSSGGLSVRTDRGTWLASAVISATGGTSQPFIPPYSGRVMFRGRQIHSSAYRTPDEFAGLRVLVVGGGNSGAQILAEVSKVAETAWVTTEPPRFLPDDVDGRVLFERATERVRAQIEGRDPDLPKGGLGDIVIVPPVREARDRDVLYTVPPFSRFVADGVVWPDGTRTAVDAVIWCTGFRPDLGHLAHLGVLEPDGHIAVENGRSTRQPRLWLLGYGEWTGAASATLAGITRSARDTVQDIQEFLAAGRT